MYIGQRIKMLRKQQGLSIDDLACRLNKNRTTVYRYENGDIENLPLGILDSLACVLNTTPAYLMGWDKDKDNDEYHNRFIGGLNIRHIERWNEEFKDELFTNEEQDKLIEYARFLISLREN